MLCRGHLSSGDSTYNKKRLAPRSNFLRKGNVRGVVGQVLLAGEETNERAADVRLVISNSPAKDWMRRFKRIQYAPLSNLSRNLDLYFALDLRERSKPLWKYHADHVNVCTSTDMTDGRSRTIACQVSPLSGET
jgi:hypothetical protein